MSAFALTADRHDADRLFRAAEAAWHAAGREVPPRLSIGVFVALGPDAETELYDFALQYLSVFGDDVAHMLAGAMPVHSPDRLRSTISAMEEVGCDELILVPASTDPVLLARMTEVVSS